MGHNKLQTNKNKRNKRAQGDGGQVHLTPHTANLHDTVQPELLIVSQRSNVLLISNGTAHVHNRRAKLKRVFFLT